MPSHSTRPHATLRSRSVPRRLVAGADPAGLGKRSVHDQQLEHPLLGENDNGTTSYFDGGNSRLSDG
jgi:hypothetical protein